MHIDKIVIPVDGQRVKVEHIFIQTIFTGSFDQPLRVRVYETAKPKPKPLISKFIITLIRIRMKREILSINEAKVQLTCP